MLRHIQAMRTSWSEGWSKLSPLLERLKVDPANRSFQEELCSLRGNSLNGQEKVDGCQSGGGLLEFHENCQQETDAGSVLIREIEPYCDMTTMTDAVEGENGQAM